MNEGNSMKFIVIKRDGSREEFDSTKWEAQISKVCAGISDVSPFMIAANARAQFTPEMTTELLDEIALRSMVNLIDVEVNPLGDPNYELVAGRQRTTMLRKKVYGTFTPPHIYEIVKKNVALGMYTKELLEWYTEEEWDQINSFIDHDRDMTYVYSQVEQMVDKYLVRNRATEEMYETPQVRYIIAAAVGFHAETENRLEWVKECYEQTSRGMFTLATPVAAGLGTPTKQFSSCVTISCDDSMDSIYMSGYAMAKYAAKRAGIGFEIGRIRGVGSPIRGGEIKHTGVVPFIQKWSKDLRSVSQGGVRTGSATINYPVWHYEFESLVVLKNNQGTEETRVRQLDYAVQFSAMFWDRLCKNQSITLFSPSDVPGLYDAFHQNIKKFEQLYLAAEANPKIRKKVISAEDVFRALFANERIGTGRIFVYNADNVQFQSPYNPETDPVVQTNLCTEILIPTRPFNNVDSEDGLIGLCTLGSICWGRAKTPEELRRPIRCLFKLLDNLLDYQDFLVAESKRHDQMYRPLGIGVTDLAHWHAQRGFVYGQQEALDEVKRFSEYQYYYLQEINTELAEKKGACSRSPFTRYANGQMIFEMRHPGVDELCNFAESTELDWSTIRQRARTFGVRASTTSAIAPVESSSLLISSTNGIALPKTLIQNKSSRSGTIIQVVPEYKELKANYEKLLMWEQESPVGYLKTVAVLQVYIDQGISADMFYNPKEIVNEITGEVEMKIDVTEFLSHHIMALNWGIKTLYYCLVNKQRLLNRMSEVGNFKQPAPVETPLYDDEVCEGCTI